MTDVNKGLEDGSLPGWSLDKTAGAQVSTDLFIYKFIFQPTAIDLSPYNSAQELEALGLERLKGALMALNLKCGGTLVERAERLYATKGHKLSDLEKTALARNNDDKDKESQRIKQLAQLEGYIQA